MRTIKHLMWIIPSLIFAYIYEVMIISKLFPNFFIEPTIYAVTVVFSPFVIGLIAIRIIEVRRAKSEYYEYDFNRKEEEYKVGELEFDSEKSKKKRKKRNTA